MNDRIKINFPILCKQRANIYKARKVSNDNESDETNPNLTSDFQPNAEIRPIVRMHSRNLSQNGVIMACHILYGRPYCNDAKEGVGGITPPKLNRGG